MENLKCKICRRIGERLFLKGDKCFSQKCPFLRKPYPPGILPKRKKLKLSEYGEQLKEAQKLKRMYVIEERQFKKLIREVLKKRGKEDVSTLLLKRLEKRLSNVISKVGLAKSRSSARQLISHSHFLLNGRKINIPSLEVKIGDEIKLKESSKRKAYFRNILALIKKENIPSWLSFDKKNAIVKVIGEPKVEEIKTKVNIPLVLSFYSK